MALRGDHEEVRSEKNPGNFISLLKVLAENDILHSHLYNPHAKNATYLSPRSQNDLINIIGWDVIRSGIVAEIKKAVFFSVLGDEVSGHNVEHMPLCIWFVDEASEIREEFMGFVKLQRVRAIDIADAIVSTIEGLGLSVGDLRGQGYDGASTMSGEKSGVQRRIRDLQLKAIYTHCAGRSLNLAIMYSCSISPI